MSPRRLRPLAVVALVLGSLLACSPPPSAPPTGAAPSTGALATAPGTSAALVMPPPAGARFDYQLGGPYPPADGVRVVARDRTAPAAPGVYSVCYLNAFQTQPDEDDWWEAHHPDLLLRDERGRLVEDAGWPGEHLLDTRTAANRAALVAIAERWVEECAAQGYRAVELDNLDSWLRSDGLLTPADNLAHAGLLVDRAHTAGLAVAQKNAPDLTRAQVRAAGFDFAVAEECQVYDECDAYTALHGRDVVEIEYTDNGLDAFHEACAARGRTISVVLRDRDVVPRGQRGYVFQHC